MPEPVPAAPAPAPEAAAPPAPAPPPAPPEAPAPAPAAATPPPAAPAPSDARLDPKSASYDPVYRGLLVGLGLAAGDTPTEEQPTVDRPSVGDSLGDHTRFGDDRRKAAAPPAPVPGTAAAPVDSPGTPPPPAPAPAPAAPATPAPAPAPIAVEKRPPIDQVVKNALRDVLGDIQPKPAAAAPAPGSMPLPPDPFEAQLTEVQKEELALAKFWATKDPARKDLPTQTLGYFKKLEEYIQKNSGEDRTFDDQDEDFMRFVRSNRPQVSAAERHKIERQQRAEEAAQVVRQEYAQELNQLKLRQHVLETQPRVEAAAREFLDTSDQVFTQGESPITPIVKRAKEVGWQAAVQEDPMFVPIVKRYKDAATRLATEYLAMYHGIKEYRPDTNPDHQWLHTFVTKKAAQFAQYGGEHTVRNGRAFVAPGQFAAMNETDRRKHWTFEEGDVLVLLAQNARGNIEEEMKTLENNLTAAGFQRGKRPASNGQLPPAATPAPLPAPSAAQPPAAPASPRATPSASPGAAQPGTPTPPPAAFDPSFYKALNLPAMAGR